MNKQKESYILWLPSWYPNKLEPYNGDFIQRHATAAALYTNLHVIHLVKDKKGSITKNFTKETFEKGRLKETIVYYHTPSKKVKLLETFLSFRKYFSLYKYLMKELFEKEGRPQLIHVYVAFKAGIPALWARRKFKLPYVVSEQWTIYLPEAQPQFSDRSFISKNLFKRIFRNAKSVMAVSEYLGQHLQHLFSIQKPFMIPNVVNGEIFQYSNKQDSAIRFVHISTLNYQKNPEAIIEAFSVVDGYGYPFTLDIIGPERAELVQLVKHYNLENKIYFHQEMPQENLVAYIKNSNALILYSRYETFGCVLIEANACGVPVIVSDIPVMHENVKEEFNGLFAANETPPDLAEKIIYFINKKSIFNNALISKYTLEKYSYETIGKQFHDWYKEALS